MNKKGSFQLSNDIYIKSGYTIVGKKEEDGNYSGNFDLVLKDDLWGEKSYEKAECKMHREAISGAIAKANLTVDDIDIMLAGDLLNELSASSFSARNFPFSFLGLYNACSTFSECMIIGSMILDAGFAENITCSTSSHFSSAERQYRYPLELGNQRTPTAQWTVTGAGACVLSINKPDFEDNRCKISQIYDEMDENDKKYVFETSKESFKYEKTHIAKVTEGTIGRVIDLGIDDESNMGAAMAPAAADTIIRHLADFGRQPDYYDAIITGDLGRYGKSLLKYILSKEGIKLPDTYMDAGAGYFKPEQQTFQGGSGAGCISSVFNGYILNQLESGALGKILVVPTGALLNKDTPLQKETIPGISHAFVVETEKIKKSILKTLKI
jgi:stage V sporulation protein AD